MQWYPFTSYWSRVEFDHHHHIGTMNGRKYKHKVDLEDFWLNVADEYDFRKRLLSKLLMNLIRTTELFHVTNHLEDDGEYIQSGFDENQPLSPIKWSEQKLVDLTTLMRQIVKYSQWWVDEQILELRRRNVTLTYNLMGEAESYSLNAGASQSDEPIESTHLGKRKGIVNDSTREKGKKTTDEEPTQKKQRSKPLHFSMSVNMNEILDIDESLGDIRTPPIHV